jgi:acyl-coenzyme A synthetase/AMP-(fatty) acid ligase
MQEKGTMRDVSAREALACIRGGMSNADLMAKFKFNAQGYADLLRQLFQRKLITEEDLERRGIRFKVVKKKQEPAPAPRAPVVAAVVAPTAADDEEFLDTMALTDLLTFKPTGETSPEVPKSKPAKSEVPDTDKDEEEAVDKKKKFSISGFFKKPL